MTGGKTGSTSPVIAALRGKIITGHTRRSEESETFQRFSVPISLSFADMVRERGKPTPCAQVPELNV